MGAVLTKLNDEAEEMEKMQKTRGRKERGKFQIRMTYSVLNLVALS